MAPIRAIVTLVLALTLALAASVAAQPIPGPEFINLAPCRVADTRDPNGPYGGPILTSGVTRNFTITGQCNVPTTATAVAFNFTVTGAVNAGHLTVWPAGGAFPPVSTLNYVAGDTVANGAIVPLSAGGAISVQPFATTHVVLDVNGYFTDVEELAGNNTAVGFNALLNNTTGNDNTALGFEALLMNTTGSDNTAVGGVALQSNTTGSFNTATGIEALGSNTTGSFNTAMGRSALFSNTTASENTATGHEALFRNTTGFNNTALGARALTDNTMGNNNTAVGFNALGESTTGGANTATGSGALASNTTGPFNTAVGFSALPANTTGTQNTATGAGALNVNTTGNQNTAVGLNALFNNTGNSNTAVGVNAGVNVTTGSNNIHIGNQGAAADTTLIRIGTAGTQTATFIAAINGANIGMGATVLVNANGQLGTMMSAAGFKEGIEDLGEASRRLLGLRPVRFRYQPQHDDPSRPLQYGLVAEEVAAVFPELVYPGPDGAPYSVRYHLLSVLLLNELQRQEREWRAEKAEAAARFEAQQAQLDELRAQVRALIGARAAIRE